MSLRFLLILLGVCILILLLASFLVSTRRYPDSHHQRATAESLAVAIDFAEALRGDPGYRLGFNSAGSSASVNHLHIQVCGCLQRAPLVLSFDSLLLPALFAAE